MTKRFFVRGTEVPAYSPANHTGTVNRRLIGPDTVGAKGVEVVLGSDAPVSTLDPWEAMAAAVHRSPGERDPWHPEQALTPRQLYWYGSA